MVPKISKNKRRNTRFKNKDDKTLPKEHNNSIMLEGEDEQIDEMPEKEFRRMIRLLLRSNEMAD